MKRKKLNHLRDLREYGIIALTGEACGLSMRTLCDLTPAGLQNIRDFFSMKIEHGNNWNHGDGQIASIMLPRGIEQELMAYFLLAEGYDIALVVNYRCRSYSSYFVEGMSRDEWCEMVDSAQERWPNGHRIYQKSPAPGTGLRNQHMMSGRVN